MFETLINIMKTAKITAQNNKVIKLTQNTGRVRDFEHDGIEDESASEKESPREEMKDEASASEGEYESEYESSADEQAGLPPSSSRYSFYDQLQNPNVDLNEVLANLKLQREVKVQEKKQLLNKLSWFELLDKHSSELKIEIRESSVIENHAESDNIYKRPKATKQYNVQQIEPSLKVEEDKDEVFANQPKVNNEENMALLEMPKQGSCFLAYCFSSF